MMKKLLFICVLALAAASCLRVEDLSYEGVESVEVRSIGVSQSAVDVFLRASNASGTSVSVVRADLTLSQGDRPLLQATVDEKVKLPRRSTDVTVRVPVRIRFEGGMFGAFGTLKTLSSGARGTTVSGEVVLKAGLMRKKFEVKDMDTERFLGQFGISLSDVMEEFGS